MELHSASTVSATEVFLHPGYESVNGEWTFPMRSIPYDKKPSIHIDFAAALELNAEPELPAATAPTPEPAQSAPAAATQEPSNPPLPPAQGLGWMPLGGSAALTVAAIASIPKHRAQWGRGRARIAAAVVCACGAVAVPIWGATRNARLPRSEQERGPAQSSTLAAIQSPVSSNLAPAASGSTKLERFPFRKPRQATIAILHGMIADAVANTKQPRDGDSPARFTSLAPFKPEIALPTRSPSPGMRYALEHYDRDGWGREFRIAFEREPVTYSISSAGEDGEFGTPDDVKLLIRSMGDRSPRDWDQQRHAFFFGELTDDSVVLLYHRDPDRTDWFRRRARELTGTELYNALTITKIQGEARLKGLKKLATEPDGDVSENPIVMLAYNPDDFIKLDQGKMTP